MCVCVVCVCVHVCVRPCVCAGGLLHSPCIDVGMWFSFYFVLFFVARLKSMLKVLFCAVGTLRRPEEEQTWVFFGDFLDECEGNRVCL